PPPLPRRHAPAPNTCPPPPLYCTYLTKWGSQGSGDGQFQAPDGVAVDGGGNGYVVDRRNNRIEEFTVRGMCVSAWVSQGSGAGQFDGPDDVAVDGSGNVYVADGNNHRIQKF